MQGNMNMVKFDKQSRFDYEEAQERTQNNKKWNKQKRQSTKRDTFKDEE